MENCLMNYPIPRLRWACRRGMLELDVLLGNFLEEQYASLPEVEQNCFIALLTENDPDLFAWLTGRALPLEPSLAQMVHKIRTHAQTRHPFTNI
jgi:antitoxin CptB